MNQNCYEQLVYIKFVTTISKLNETVKYKSSLNMNVRNVFLSLWTTETKSEKKV